MLNKASPINYRAGEKKNVSVYADGISRVAYCDNGRTRFHSNIGDTFDVSHQVCALASGAAKSLRGAIDSLACLPVSWHALYMERGYPPASAFLTRNFSDLSNTTTSIRLLPCPTRCASVL